ncbi:hypothetical protein [Dyella flagellata]|uniref:Uncharacterized protein n=1 Tax=Dyella flagellata TaxID=1867833 RepID=A0ABQ5X7G8_9GAMM|nr:hypothetical protein [Dyella flagellata]GLQ87144.1 hypothetical protein GCM10007898_07100 [Dyella flagellata]
MNQASELDIYTQFNSLNGGVSMWIPRFSHHLVERGVDAFFEDVREEAAKTKDRRLRNDLHFLSKGVKSIDKQTLEAVIASLRGPFQTIVTLSSRHEHCVASMKQAEGEWRRAADRAKQQLEAWGRWAYETEVTRYKRLFAWHNLVPSLKLSFEFRSEWDVLSSPQRLRTNLEFFEIRIEAIRGVISTAYIVEALPINLEPVEFDEAIDCLLERQAKVDHWAETSHQIEGEWRAAGADYLELEKPLLELLRSMPNTALWALFRICRPDLREWAEADTFQQCVADALPLEADGY